MKFWRMKPALFVIIVALMLLAACGAPGDAGAPGSEPVQQTTSQEQGDVGTGDRAVEPALVAQIVNTDIDTRLEIAAVEIRPNQITWQPVVEYEYSGTILSVNGPNGYDLQVEFDAETPATFSLVDGDGVLRPDGSYTYELQVTPVLGPEAQAAYAAAVDSRDPEVITQLREAGLLPEGPFIGAGSFTIADGAFVIADGEEPGGGGGTPSPLEDVVHPDDVIINGGSLCVGFDCVNGESFGSDTIRLKENNLRIHFEDTSASASFPSNDWRILINGTQNGDPNYFAIQDSNTSRTVFLIEAGAIANALYVDDEGDVGIGTSTPVVEAHLVDGNTPTMRLEQNGSSGFAAQTWDVAANEANFFIRDVTNGSQLPFVIKPGAASDTLYLAANDNVGIGLDNPSEKLHVNGNLLLNGLLIEASDVNLKDNLVLVDGDEVLEALAGLPLYSWNYESETPDVRHLGPTAQDFYAAFGLGIDERHISPLDTNGVALAGVQALHAEIEAQEQEIATLQQQNDALEARLQQLEARIGTAQQPVNSMLLAALAFAVLAFLFIASLYAVPRMAQRRER